MKITVDLSDLVEEVISEEEAEKLGKQIALDFHRGVKRRTPVDTGNARNAWDVDLNGENPIVENNVEYIGALNRGHSKQAPAGFVEAELDAALRRLTR